MVILSLFRKRFLKIPALVSTAGILLFTLVALTGCSSDSKQLKASRDSFIHEDYLGSEAALYHADVFKQSENRFVHYSSLASIAMSQGLYEKAIYFLVKSRDLANNLRSSQSGFTWFSNDYKSNGIEYSYLHYFLVMAHLLLAEEGKTPAWTTPEIRDSDKNILIAAQSFPAKTFDAREIADLRRKARSELLAWDTHLQALKNSDPGRNYYRDDLWARMLASYVHGISDQNSERRTAELLAEDAQRLLQQDFQKYPSKKYNEAAISGLSQKLKTPAEKNSLFIVEAGVMSKYKIKRFHLGLSTLFKNIKDPGLRSFIEQVGFRILLETSPEFGLVLFSGAIAGASGSSDEDSDYEGPPRQFTDAVDESFGFLIQFPSLESPSADTKVSLDLTNSKNVHLTQIQLPVVSPLQEMISTDLKLREEREMLPEAIKVGLQYLAILVPAVQLYKQAQKEGNFFKKLGAVAGYYMAKKIIDNAHRPELRSWNYLPKLIAADVITAAPGVYSYKVTIENVLGKFEKDLGVVELGNPKTPIIRRRIGEVSILKSPRSFETIKP